MVAASSGLALNFEALRLDIGGCGPGIGVFGFRRVCELQKGLWVGIEGRRLTIDSSGLKGTG